MDIDEMKNKISMELKNPITQQGFEIICKNLADLEKENAEAREIIKGLMRFCRCFAQHHTEDIRYKEAEQFLQEK